MRILTLACAGLALSCFLLMCRAGEAGSVLQTADPLPLPPSDTTLPLILQQADSLIQWRAYGEARTVIDTFLSTQKEMPADIKTHAQLLWCYAFVRDHAMDDYASVYHWLGNIDSGGTQRDTLNRALRALTLGFYFSGQDEKVRHQDSAQYYFDKALHIASSYFSADDPRMQPYYRDIGSYYLSGGRTREGIKLLQDEEVLHTRWQYPPVDRFIHHYNLGTALRGLEDYDLAAHYQHRAINVLRTSGSETDERIVLPFADLCYIAASTNEIRRLNRLVDTTLGIVNIVFAQDSFNLIDYHCTLAMCYAPGYTNHPERGLEILDALSINEIDTNRYATSYAEVLRTRAYLRRGLSQHESARNTMHRAIAMYERAMPLEDSYYQHLYADAKLGLGVFELEDGLPVQEAIKHVEEASEIMFSTPLHVVAKEIPVRHLKYYDRWYDYLIAYGHQLRDNLSDTSGANHIIRLCARIDSVITTTRQKVSDYDMLRNAQLSHDIYTYMMRWCHELQHTDRTAFLQLSFELLEKSRGHMLLSQLSTSALAGQYRVPQEVIDEGRRLATEELATYEMLDEAEIDALLARKQEYFTSLKHDHPEYFQRSYQPARTTLQEVRTAIGANEAMIMFQLRDMHLYTFVITADSVALLHSEYKTVCNDAAAALYNLVSTRPAAQETDFIPYVQLSTHVFDCVLREAYPLLRDKAQWWIAADGILELTPFEALLSSPDTTATGYHTLPYLVHQHTIGYILSATTWMDARAKPDPSPKNLAVFIHSDGTHEVRSARVQEASLRYQGMPGTAVAARAITTTFGRDRVRTIANKNATREAFFNALPHYDLLHLGLHAYADTTGRQRHGIVFPGDTTPLMVSDIIGREVKASIVFLEGCETGVGKQARGEGTLNFARPFIVAGAQHVLASRWKLDDRTAAILSGHFYRQLKDGAYVPSANCGAKRTFLKQASRLNAHPYYWAAVMSVQ